MTGYALSAAQSKALALAPKFSAALSIPSSLYIIAKVVVEVRRGKSKAVSRALLGMSVVDVISSVAWFASTWLVPTGTEGVPYASGNAQTCNFQGFLLQLSIGAPLYNCSMALYYVLVIRFGWREEHIATIEPWVHATIAIFTLGTSVAGLPLALYNHVGSVCWIQGYPQNCSGSSLDSNDTPCIRGDNAWIYGIALFYGPLWLSVLFASVLMTLVFCSVYATERRSSKYSMKRLNSNTTSVTNTHGESTTSVVQPPRRTGTKKKNWRESLTTSFKSGITTGGAWSDEVATQVVLYTLSFFVTWFPSTIWSLAHFVGHPMFWADLLAAICEPLQGFWNLLVFLRPRSNERKKVLSALTCWKRALCQSNPQEEEEDWKRTDDEEASPTDHR